MESKGGTFRPIQYIGNKSRMLDSIESAVDLVADTSRRGVCDLFAGTGVVTRRLADRRAVLSNDIQHYSAILTRAQCRPFSFPATLATAFIDDVTQNAFDILQRGTGRLAELEKVAVNSSSDDLLIEIVECGSINASRHVSMESTLTQSSLRCLLSEAGAGLKDLPYSSLSRYYGGVYFGYEQAAYLDGAIVAAQRLSEEARVTAVAAILSAASQLATSVGGHFAQPIRVTTRHGAPKPAGVTSVRRSRQMHAVDVLKQWINRWSAQTPSSAEVVTTTSDFRAVAEQLPNDVGAVYADPPYTRDHYSRFYHVLETIALADDPGLSTTRVGGLERPTRGLYRVDRHQSPFSIVSEAPRALHQLCNALSTKSVKLVLSYSPVPETFKPRDRVMTLDTITSIVAQYYADISVVIPGGMVHSKFNSATLNAPVAEQAEVLLVCR